jgi:hypothetical protein
MSFYRFQTLDGATAADSSRVTARPGDAAYYNSSSSAGGGGGGLLLRPARLNPLAASPSIRSLNTMSTIVSTAPNGGSSNFGAGGGGGEVISMAALSASPLFAGGGGGNGGGQVKNGGQSGGQIKNEKIAHSLPDFCIFFEL